MVTNKEIYSHGKYKSSSVAGEDFLFLNIALQQSVLYF